MNELKKNICCILVVVLILLSLPIEVSTAIGSEQVFFDYLTSEGILKYNVDNKLANYSTYQTYNLIVYGSPWGDSKVSGTKTERRYLGYTFLDAPYTNPSFPSDSNTGEQVLT